ncbi:hypothetical protein [Azospirillum argentinense]
MGHGFRHSTNVPPVCLRGKSNSRRPAIDIWTSTLQGCVTLRPCALHTTTFCGAPNFHLRTPRTSRGPC